MINTYFNRNTITETFTVSTNCTEVILYRPNAKSKQLEGMHEHTDGHQVMEESSISALVIGATSSLALHVGKVSWSFSTPGNSGYSLQPFKLEDLSDDEKQEVLLWWKEDEIATYPLPR
jgi:hypothetical protein